MAVQQGRSDVNERGVPLRYVELFHDARTMLADFFSILLNFKLGLIQPRIHPAPFHEGLVVAFLDNRPALYHDDAIHVMERGQAVSNDESRSPLGQIVQGFTDFHFGFSVDIGGGQPTMSHHAPRSSYHTRPASG